jgi:hypothetical protein
MVRCIYKIYCEFSFLGATHSHVTKKVLAGSEVISISWETEKLETDVSASWFAMPRVETKRAGCGHSNFCSSGSGGFWDGDVVAKDKFYFSMNPARTRIYMSRLSGLSCLRVSLIPSICPLRKPPCAFSSYIWIPKLYLAYL